MDKIEKAEYYGWEERTVYNAGGGGVAERWGAVNALTKKRIQEQRSLSFKKKRTWRGESMGGGVEKKTPKSARQLGGQNPPRKVPRRKQTKKGHITSKKGRSRSVEGTGAKKSTPQ